MEERLNEVVAVLRQETEEYKEQLDAPSVEVLEEQRQYFMEKFSKEKLIAMTPAEALEQLMYSKNLESMVYILEFKKDEEFKTTNFGSISGGSAGKFTIFYSNRYKQWVKWEGGRQVRISDGEAERRADQIRLRLLKLHDIIQDSPHKTLEDVRAMVLEIESDEDLADFYRYGWVHNYFHMFYPDKISNYHSARYARSILVKARHPFGEIIQDSEWNTYILDYFYIDLAKRLDVSQEFLSQLLWRIPGEVIKTYYKLDQSKYPANTVSEMVRSKYYYAPINLEIDLTNISSLSEMRELVKLANYTKPSALRVNMTTKAPRESDMIVLVDNNKMQYIGVVTGTYEFVKNEKFPHRIPVEWFHIKESYQVEISGSISSVIQKVNGIRDQVNIERALDNSRKISVAGEIKPNNLVKISPLKGIMKEVNSLLTKKKQVILSGAPGTGKTHWALNTVYELLARQEFNKSFVNLTVAEQEAVKGSEKIKVIVLHSNYGYEEFVEGLRPENKDGNLEFQVKAGVFKEFADKAANDVDNNYYLILDEINRTDLTKVFGELIFSIENTKRGEYIELALSKKPFTVPENVMIIGTMNNADKSVALIDLALRRRFGFIELETDYDLIDTTIGLSNSVLEDEIPNDDFEGEREEFDLASEINLSLWLQDVNERLIETLGSEGKDLQIGHSYFLSKGEVISEISQFVEVLKYELIPLLEEYTYNNTEQLKNILGRNMFDSNNRLRSELLEENKFLELIEALEV